MYIPKDYYPYSCVEDKEEGNPLHFIDTLPSFLSSLIKDLITLYFVKLRAIFACACEGISTSNTSVLILLKRDQCINSIKVIMALM